MDIKSIWTHEKKIKIATGLTLKEASELIDDFEVELNVIRLNKNGNSNNIDGTEQPIRKPQNKLDQRKNYSGKKRTIHPKFLLLMEKTRELKL